MELFEYLLWFIFGFISPIFILFVVGLIMIKLFEGKN